VLDPVSKLRGLHRHGEQLEVVDTLADAHEQLVAEDDAGERLPGPLTPRRLRQ
jgi:hypothetical protein